MILYLPNFLSVLRVPLAFLFLSDNGMHRAFAICMAMLTDGIDGYVARRYQAKTRFGATLDPLMDKFFVIFALSALVREQQISVINALCMLVRDFSVLLFGCYLVLSKKWPAYQFRAIWTGKIITCLQFLILLCLSLHIVVPESVYIVFLVLGMAALCELYMTPHLPVLTHPSQVSND